ncbi:MAG: cation-translocating P-type ATPase [Clostridia bacterium]|nr:MAG: cation-translocating P-type ATPase [Clostridia bacterium]
MPVAEVAQVWQSDAESGLSPEEAARRLASFGANRLRAGQRLAPAILLARQFTDFMVLVLLGAAAVSAFLGEWLDAVTILAIVVLNAVLGFMQEYRAEKSLEALRRLTAPEARVMRAGETQRLPADAIVPGDILVLEAGDRVPADARLVGTVAMEVDESALTGESVPVSKSTAPLPGTAGPGDQRNMVFQGTVVTRGRGRGMVVATGMDTQMGQIAGMIEEAGGQETPLQRRLGVLGRWLVAVCLGVCALVVFLGLARGLPTYQMFLAGVSLAVAAIPEGLPAIVTVALAIGVQRMSRRNAIVRQLPAVETLGCATCICSDKTGTLTQNKMVVREIALPERKIVVSGEGYVPQGDFHEAGRRLDQDPQLEMFLQIAAVCNNAVLKKDNITVGGWLRRKPGPEWQVAGDPTEGALLVAAAKGGFWREDVESREPRAAEIPFDSERKRMTVVTRRPGGMARAWIKGAPDIVLKLCTGVLTSHGVEPLTEARQARILAQNDALAGQAYRVLAMAYRDLPPGFAALDSAGQVEKDLVFVGLAGIIDPLRPETAKAIRVCRTAGIKTVMVTGDHELTARAIAIQAGLGAEELRSLTGMQLEAMSDAELAAAVEEVDVFARVSPHHKLRLVRALRAKGHVVAMTGDGINDAPAIKEADIGVAMGQAGTEVTREAAALVLADDNFATITAAVEEGRAIYNNIRKFVQYLLSCNAGEVLTMMLAMVVGIPVPLLPIQILWMNLVTDGLPAMALGLDRPEMNLMRQPPRSPREGFFAHGMATHILVRGSLICAGTISVFILALLWSHTNLALARSMAFNTLVFSQLFYVLEISGWSNLRSNYYLLLAVTVSVLMQLAVTYWGPLQVLFETVPLSPIQMTMALVAAGLWTLLVGLQKLLVAGIWRRLVVVRA